MNNLNGRLIKPKAIFIANSEIGDSIIEFSRGYFSKLSIFSLFLPTFVFIGDQSNVSPPIPLIINSFSGVDHKSLRKMNRWMILEIVLGDST